MDEKAQKLECFFKEKEISPEYKIIENYFDISRCNEIKLIGPVASLCKESNARNVVEWVDYYKTTPYFTNLGASFLRIKNTLNQNNLFFEDKVLKSCLQTFVFWKTWCGCLAEINARSLLQDEDFICCFANKDMDRNYSVDLLLFYRKKIVMGIQVKPTSYLGAVQSFNVAKNEQFQKTYDREVVYLYYDSATKIFRPEDLEAINNKKKKILEQEKPEVIKTYNPFLSAQEGKDCYSEVSYILVNSWYKTEEEMSTFKFLAHLKEAEKHEELYNAYKARLISLWGHKLFEKVKQCYLDNYDTVNKIKDISPELIVGYDKEGNAILANNEKINTKTKSFAIFLIK